MEGKRIPDTGLQLRIEDGPVREELRRIRDAVRAPGGVVRVGAPGGASDQALIQRAISTAGPGGRVYIPKGVYRVNAPIVIDQDGLVLDGAGTLKVEGNGDYDQVVHVTANDVTARVNIDQSAVSSHSGRGEGVRITGERCILSGHIVGERSVQQIGTNNGVMVWATAHDATLRDLVVEQAGYAAIRHNGSDRLLIDRVWSLDYENKGYTYNGVAGANGSVHFAWFYASTSSAATASEGLLVDPADQALRMALLTGDFIYIAAGNRSNGVKVEYCDTVLIDRIVVDGTSLDQTGGGCLRFNEVYQRVHVGTAILTSSASAETCLDVGFTSTVDIQVDYLKARHGPTNVRHQGSGTMTLGKAILEEATTQAIRWDADDGGKLVVHAMVQESSSASIPGLAVFPNAGAITPGDLVVLRRELVTGTADVSAVAGVNRKIQRNLGQPRVFRDSTDPASAGETVAYEAGDLVYDISPSAGGTMGWICTAAGSPGTWKAFGNIAS